MNLQTIESTAPFMEDIKQVDFTMIKLKLQDKEEGEGEGWSVEQCNENEELYKRFLALKRLYPDKDIVPHKTIDIFWHQHILDTEKYAQDCEIIFGHFLHHYPYFGMNGEEDKKNLFDSFEETKQLYAFHFNDNYVGMAPKCKSPKCRTACKPAKCK